MAKKNDTPAEDNVKTLWRGLLVTAEKNASVISNEVINDAVLGKSVTAAISPYFGLADTANFMREEFATADQACQDMRATAAATMHALGFSRDWTQDDLKAADEELWTTINNVTARAAELNKKRAAAMLREREALDNAIDVIDTCAGIATLRHLNEFRCEGDAFCTAYVAALSIAETLIGKSMKSKGMKVLADFLQYAVGAKAAYRDCDIYVHSKTAFGIGRTMGIDNSYTLRTALVIAVKKNSTTPTVLRPHMDIPDSTASGSSSSNNNGIGNLIDFDL